MTTPTPELNSKSNTAHANSKTPELLLAPMEGVTDFLMRELLTSIGGIDMCVTEFLRVTDKLHPYQVFYKNCPELKQGSKTKSGTPVLIQLLGGQAAPLAENAFRAYQLGAFGIDLNFGCPAKTVNRHDGGATLLKSSDRLFQIASAVRKAVPLSTTVSAKIRLGFDDPSQCIENVQALSEAKVSWITVHCRTKTDGYKPPAYWEWIPKIKSKVQNLDSLNLITNGEIWSLDDFQKCHELCQTNRYMIGRAALRNPFIFQNIKMKREMEPEEHIKNTLPLLIPFFESATSYINDHFATSRTKQWLSQLKFQNPIYKNLFDIVKVEKKPNEFIESLKKETFKIISNIE